MEREPSHYRRLGVPPSATTEEIRAAYRSLAARLHPDRQGDASDADRAFAERRMREINEAWHVLGDLGRRADYDASRLRSARRPTTAPDAGPVRRPVPESADEPDADLVDVLPNLTAVQAGLLRHLPWLVLVVVLGGIFILTAYAAGGDGSDRPRGPAEVPIGSCIDIATGPSTTVVPCTEDHEFRIVERVAEPTACPQGTEARRLGIDGRFDCLVEG